MSRVISLHPHTGDTKEETTVSPRPYQTHRLAITHLFRTNPTSATRIKYSTVKIATVTASMIASASASTGGHTTRVHTLPGPGTHSGRTQRSGRMRLSRIKAVR